jgi:hypothetical protein
MAESAGAVSEENAKTVEELNLSKREIRTLKRLVGRKSKENKRRQVLPF